MDNTVINSAPEIQTRSDSKDFSDVCSSCQNWHDPSINCKNCPCISNCTNCSKDTTCKCGGRCSSQSNNSEDVCCFCCYPSGGSHVGTTSDSNKAMMFSESDVIPSYDTGTIHHGSCDTGFSGCADVSSPSCDSGGGGGDGGCSSTCD